MANLVTKKLRDELDRIERERDRLAKQADHFREVIAYFEQVGDEDDAIGRPAPAKPITNEMWRILEEEGSPLHYQTIYERLRQRGVAVPGKEPARNVGAHLSNDPRFQNVGRGLWGLKSWRGSPPGGRIEPAGETVVAIPSVRSIGPSAETVDQAQDEEPTGDDIERFFASLADSNPPG